ENSATPPPVSSASIWSQTGAPQPAGPGMRPSTTAGRAIAGRRNPGGGSIKTSPDVAPMATSVGDPGARVKYTGPVVTAPVKTKRAGHSSRETRSSAAGSMSPSPGAAKGPQGESAKPLPSSASTFGGAGGPKGKERNTSGCAWPPAASHETLAGGGTAGMPTPAGATGKRVSRPWAGPGGRGPEVVLPIECAGQRPNR